MDTSHHSLSTLFAQLGLPNDEASIDAFIEDKKPLAKDVPVYEAPWWNDAQATFLQESLDDDSDWAVWVDHLATRLRE